MILTRPTLTLATALSILSLALPFRAIAQDTRILTVTGQGEVAIPTTIAGIRLGVQAQGENAEQVQQEVARRTAAVLDLLQERNVEKLQTTGVRLQPQYNNRDDEQRLTGYIATNSIAFRIAIPQAGRVIDATLQAGASQINGVNFLASEESVAIASEEALRLATQAALDQADVVLDRLNLSRQEVVRISINNANANPPQFSRSTFLLSGEDNLETRLVGGDQTVSATVTLEIEY